MNQYFSKVTADYWAAKNKLQEEAKQIARESERQIIPATELESFINTIRLRIDALNKKYNRCKPLIHYSWTPTMGSPDKAFMVDYVFHLTFYHVNESK